MFKQWSMDWHENFKDLNPELNPSYKFQHKRRAELIAIRYFDKIKQNLRKAIEDKMFEDFQRKI